MNNEEAGDKTVDLKGVPKRGKVVWQNLEGEAVLLNPDTGDYFGLNEVACSFWEKVDGARSIEEILEGLLKEYEVERDELFRDIMELIERMRPYNLLSFE